MRVSIERVFTPLSTGEREVIRRRGAAAVEFALILPLLLTVMLGCVDLGRFAATSIALAGAARTGAGFGSDHPYTPATYGLWQSQVQLAVTNELGQDGYNNEQLTVTAVAASQSDGLAQTQVTVSYPFQTVVNWPGLPSSLTLQQTAVMRATRP